MKKSIALVLSVLLMLLLPINTSAQSSYYFSVTREVVNVYWNKDGTLALDYVWNFANQPGAHIIDFVDVGMPNSNFDMSTVKADVGGSPVSVSRSDYQGNGSGFAVVLGAQAIGAARTGTVHVYVGRISDVLYKDDNDANYVSGVFAPTYFGSQYISGSTDLTLAFHLPSNVQPDEPRWHVAPSGFPSQPQTGYDDQNRITYTWRNESASASRQYQFGASFPKSYVPADSIVTVRVPSFSISSDTIGAIFFCGFFAFFFLVIPVVNIVAGQRRKLQYLPPKISIEGHGIKRGLTAVEAAILMGEPLDKVMTMILFGVIKKGAANVVSRDPLKVEWVYPRPDGMHSYEVGFMNALVSERAGDRRNALSDMTIKLIRSVSEKMKGFSRRETIDYYKKIMEKAWQQVEQADTPEVKGQLFDQNLEWTMLDRNYDDRTRRVFTGPVFVPHWWHHYDPMWSGGGVSSSRTSMPSSTGRGGSSALPGADFAASVVTGVQTFSSKVIGNVGDFTSRVTKVTNPPPPPPKRSSSSGRSGGGGHSCACACACAGCACACAGGGR